MALDSTQRIFLSLSWLSETSLFRERFYLLKSPTKTKMITHELDHLMLLSCSSKWLCVLSSSPRWDSQIALRPISAGLPWAERNDGTEKLFGSYCGKRTDSWQQRVGASVCLTWAFPTLPTNTGECKGLMKTKGNQIDLLASNRLHYTHLLKQHMVGVAIQWPERSRNKWKIFKHQTQGKKKKKR